MDIVLLLHSLVRFLIIIIAVVGVIKTIVNLARQAAPAGADRGIGSAFLGLYDLQVLLGLLIILLGGLTNAIHPIIMFIGVIIGHVLQRMSRQGTGNSANWTLLALYIVPLLIILGGLAAISHLPY